MTDSHKKIVKDVLASFNHIKNSIQKIRGIREGLVDLCIRGEISRREFFRVSSLLTPQSRSPMWQNFYITEIGATKNSRNDNNGDFNYKGVNYEYKASCNDDDLVNIVQIRLWQGCDYIIQFIRVDKSVTTFRLSHEQMEAEMDALKAVPAHGTVLANKKNENLEYRMTFEVGGYIWSRWMQEYLVDVTDLSS